MVSGHLTAISAPSKAQQPLEDSSQQANASTNAESWQKEREGMVETVEVLEKHKDWADKKIGQLIKRVTEAERPQKDEAYRLRDEVRPLPDTWLLLIKTCAIILICHHSYACMRPCTLLFATCFQRAFHRPNCRLSPTWDAVHSELLIDTLFHA